MRNEYGNEQPRATDKFAGGVPLKICLIAGEASGDNLGAGLIRELTQRMIPQPVFCGIGGATMALAGLQSLFPMNDLSVMGIAEILPRLPRLAARLSQAVAMIEREQPDLLVTIDSPDFCMRVLRRVRKRGVFKGKAVHFVAPTVWAWRPERAAALAALYQGVLCLYPCEPPYFEAVGMKAAFIGHPALENAKFCDRMSGVAMRRQSGIANDVPLLGVLFGSRMGELNRVGPSLRRAASMIAARWPGVEILAPTFPHLAPQVNNLLAGIGCKTHILTEQHLKFSAFAAMDRAIAVSGTVGLELALCDVPHVIAYRANPLTYRMVRDRIKIRYAHLANILLDAPLVPEFIQHGCEPAAIAQACIALDPALQKSGFIKIRHMLAGAGAGVPSAQAADFIVGRIISDP